MRRPGASLLAAAGALAATWAAVAAVVPAAPAGPVGAAVRTYGGDAFGRTDRAGAGFPRALAAGDFDGDHRTDLALGAPTDPGAAPGGGWVGVARGAAAFPGTTFAEPGTERDGGWGTALAVGDFDADGYDDLVIGAPTRDFGALDSGVLYLWPGSPAGVGQGARPFGPALGAGALVGAALAVGDFNGDGVDDVAVGAPGSTVDLQAGAGRVVILPGRPGAGPVASGGLTIDRGRADVPGAATPRERLGDALAAGDFTAAGRDELAIGAPRASISGTNEAGIVLVATMATYPVTGGLRVARVRQVDRSQPPVPGDASRNGAFGATLAVGDFDGDGRDDLVIGSPGAAAGGRSGAGDLVVLYGAAGFPDGARAETVSQAEPDVPGQPEGREAFAAALAVGDLDGDGRDDLAIGAPGERAGALPDVGTVTLVLAGNAGLLPRRALVLAPSLDATGFAPEARLAFGARLLAAELNGDGLPDLAIGAPGMSRAGVAEAGALVVAWGDHPALPGVATATTRPGTGTPRPSASPATPGSPTAPPYATTAPASRAYLAYVTRLRSLDLWGTPVPRAR